MRGVHFFPKEPLTHFLVEHLKPIVVEKAGSLRVPMQVISLGILRTVTALIKAALPKRPEDQNERFHAS
jgi:fructosamine-3-kinase